jgi:hypothetical protein
LLLSKARPHFIASAETGAETLGDDASVSERFSAQLKKLYHDHDIFSTLETKILADSADKRFFRPA